MFTISNYSFDSEKYTVITFYPGLELFVEIHDPRFFIYTDKDLTIPKVRRFLELPAGQTTEYWLNVDAEYQELLDRPGQRCQEGPEYSFTGCVEESLVRRVGCWRVWDQHHSHLQPCTDIQARNLKKVLSNIFLILSNCQSLTELTRSWRPWT